MVRRPTTPPGHGLLDHPDSHLHEVELGPGDYLYRGLIRGYNLDERVFDFGSRRRHKIGIKVGRGLHLDAAGRPAVSPRWVANRSDWLLLIGAFALAYLLGVLVETLAGNLWIPLLFGTAVILAVALGWALRAAYGSGRT